MSGVSDYVRCEQCGFEHASYDLDCDTSAASVTCRMCGFYTACERAVGSEGKVTWSYPEQQGFGVLFYSPKNGCGCAAHHLDSEESVQNAERWLRKEIAAGEVEASGSYLTRWNPATKSVEFVIGSPDTPEPKGRKKKHEIR